LYFLGLFLIAGLFFGCKSPPPPIEEFEEVFQIQDIEEDDPPALPVVYPPVFNITDIAILQAELINTRFRVGLRIDNPNPFPIELSAFTYRLYGNGLFWAGGHERNVLTVNGNSSLSGNIFLLMNFIDMDRNLLDQIIQLEDVNYRFMGNVQVSTGVEDLPKFNSSFALSGYSRVLER
jgi:LEA14-like dessication related protein